MNVWFQTAHTSEPQRARSSHLPPQIWVDGLEFHANEERGLDCLKDLKTVLVGLFSNHISTRPSKLLVGMSLALVLGSIIETHASVIAPGTVSLAWWALEGRECVFACLYHPQHLVPCLAHERSSINGGNDN